MSDRVKTNSVFHNSPIKKHLTDFKYDTVYFGTPHKLSSLTMKLDDVLFVSPLKGIASIFAVRPQNISKYCSLIDKNGDTSFNRNYKEWNKNSTDYLKEVHVSIIGSNLSVKPTVEDVSGYVYELKLTPELKEHIWWGNNMGPQDFEVVLKDLDSVTFNDMKEINVKMYISDGKNTTVQESYQPDNTTGTAEVDDFEDKDPDDCYCESHGPYFGSAWGVMPHEPLSEFVHFFQEAKLSTKDRNNLKNSQFALVYTDAKGKTIRKYPLYKKRDDKMPDESHVRSASQMFPRGVPNEYRKHVASKILSAGRKLGLDTSGWNNINNTLKKN